MERLRYVARARGSDPAVLVAETAEAIDRLRPDPADLVTVCRRLVDRNPACAPMWWFCASLLADPCALDRVWELADEIEHDRTPLHLAHAIADGATVATVGCPELIGEAIARRGDVTVLAVDTGGGANAFVRRCDRADVEAHLVAAEAALPAVAAADVVLVEVDACSLDVALAVMGSGMAVTLATATGTPVWLVTGRGRRLPAPYCDAIARLACAQPSWANDIEAFAGSLVQRVVGPDGVTGAARALVPECAYVPELVPPAE